MIDEASRERFIYVYQEPSGYSTVDFVKRAIIYLGYTPETVQTDDGAEFTRSSKTDRAHPFDVLCHRLKAAPHNSRVQIAPLKISSKRSKKRRES